MQSITLSDGTVIECSLAYSKAKYYPGLFLRNYYPLKGKDWVRKLPAEDRKVFSDIGRERAPSNLPSIGGQARAKQAKRDASGKFVKAGSG